LIQWLFRHNWHIGYVVLSVAGIPENSFLLAPILQDNIHNWFSLVLDGTRVIGSWDNLWDLAYCAH
jgi:hypothetical protein